MNDRHAISPYPIRMPSELRQRLEQSAKQGSRSLHAEIISRLEASYDYIPVSRSISVEEGVAELNELQNQQSALIHIQTAKIRALVDLKAEINDFPSAEEKAALVAATIVAQAEIESLSKQRHEAMQKYDTLLAQIKLNAKTLK